MDHKWLEDLVALARERSFSKAAELRCVTQPQFSRRIRALEVWAGAELIERRATPLRLTAAGEALLPAARSAAANLDEARTRIARTHSSSRWVTLATGRTLSRTLVPRLLARAQGTATPFHLRLITGSLHDCSIALQHGAADLLLSYAHPRLHLALDDALYESVSLQQEALVAVCAPDVTGQPKFKLPGSAKKPVPLLGFAPALAMQQILQDALARRNLVLHTALVVESDFAESLHELALQGMGVAWLPRSLVSIDLVNKRLVACSASIAAIDFEVRIYRARGHQSALLQQVWRGFLGSD